MALLNLEVSPIQDQIASAVLDLQGNVLTLTTPTNPNQTIDSTATNLLYQIFLEVGSLHLPSFRRITISSASLSGSRDLKLSRRCSTRLSTNRSMYYDPCGIFDIWWSKIDSSSALAHIVENAFLFAIRIAILITIAGAVVMTHPDARMCKFLFPSVCFSPIDLTPY